MHVFKASPILLIFDKWFQRKEESGGVPYIKTWEIAEEERYFDFQQFFLQPDSDMFFSPCLSQHNRAESI